MVTEQKLFEWLARQGMEWLGKGRLAKTTGRLHVPGLESRVEVFRDRWGVPHIYAANEVDLFFAQGFVHAQDRFFQMETQRRLVAGRLSEIFGQVAVVADRWMRVLGLYRTAEQEVDRLDDSGGRILAAYTAGINAWLKYRHLPVEFALLRYDPEPWTLADSLCWSKMISWTLSGNWELELFRKQLVDKLGSEQVEKLELLEEENWPLVLDLPDLLGLKKNMSRLAREWTGPGAGQGVGSNNWVVSGERTRSGKPLLSNDMHMLLSAPSIWYENHLVGGGLDVTGISLPGLPFVVSGHNGHVAWGFTSGFADVQDLYEEHLRTNPEGQIEYEYQGAWYPAEVRTEEIAVRFGAVVTEEVVVTRHGPIITPLLDGETLTSLADPAATAVAAADSPSTEPAAPPLALCWTASETSGGTFRATLEMCRAKNCAEFQEAMRTWNTPVLNAVYADTQGNIAYNLIGKVPIRAQGEGYLPVPGWDGEHEWTGYIPYDGLPCLFNPPSGYIATANNHVAGPDYPYFLGRDYVCSDRAERIVELILRQPLIDIPYIQAMQFDQVSPSAQTISALVGQVEVEDPQLQQAVALLRDWDGHLHVDNPASALYEVLVRELWGAIFENHLGELMPRFKGAMMNQVAIGNIWGQHAWEWLRRELVHEDSPWFDLGNGETRDDVLRLALRRAVDFLVERQGPDAAGWSWGLFHQVTFQHMLGRVKPLDAIFNRGPYPVGGDANTIWATASPLDRVDASEGMVGPPFRFIADLSDLTQSLGLLAPGQSGQVGSPHYDDQVQSWFEGGYHPILYKREDIERDHEACLELLP